MSVPDQLLVLGNGFDLQCGLASSFLDFEEPRKNKISEIVKKRTSITHISVPATPSSNNEEEPKKSLFTDFRDAGITAWDPILIADKQVRTWYDVEACIRDWLLNHPDGNKSSGKNELQAVRDQCARFRQAITEEAPHKDDDRFAALYNFTEDSAFNRSSVDEQVAKLLLKWYACDADDYSVMKAMMQELHHLEAAFSTHLKAQTENNTDYLKGARHLLNKLLNDQLSNGEGNGDQNTIDGKLTKFDAINTTVQNTRILDFNYTDPVYGLGNASSLLTNIHGNVHGGDIVFGIDSNSVDTNAVNYPELVKFTKTYRLMALGKGPKTSLVHPHVSGQPGRETDIIKFFGHSLGDPDYSYFQAIFDEVDLYGGDTRLIFYYNQNRPNEKKGSEKSRNTTSESAQEEMFEKVNRLITTYGQTLDNKDHGRNLMHKLLLENRLQVIQAPV